MLDALFSGPPEDVIMRVTGFLIALIVLAFCLGIFWEAWRRR